MSLTKTLTQRFFTISKLASSSAQPLPPARPASSSLLNKLLAGSAHDRSLLRRFLHRRPVSQATSIPPTAAERLALPVGEKLIERIRSASPSRIRLDELIPPPMPPATIKVPEGITVADAKKAVRAVQMEATKARLRATGRTCVPYAEFVGVCREVSGAEQGMALASALDESGAVVVLGDIVFLRPEMVAKALENLIPDSFVPASASRKELEEMEQKKAEIDVKADALVRRELWAGLGFLVLQTAGFMRLTFWELSWDVMEPICFYVTSVYFMAGYAFFLRTSKDPSFEGFYESRFAAKQRRLMKARDFDVVRFNELKAPVGRHGRLPSPSNANTASCASSSFEHGCDCSRKNTATLHSDQH